MFPKKSMENILRWSEKEYTALPQAQAQCKLTY